jgi:hypothetical protein
MNILTLASFALLGLMVTGEETAYFIVEFTIKKEFPFDKVLASVYFCRENTGNGLSSKGKSIHFVKGLTSNELAS